MSDKRTYASRAEYIKRAVVKRRNKVRSMALKVLGGHCMVCGYNKCTDALEFHHRNPNIKEFSLSLDKLTRSWMRVEQELKKCILLCANCHREYHAGITQLPKETLK
jgi:5-methylcytosine-specific restriction endonuclease McrA